MTSPTILVVDDDPLICELIETCLRREGYSVAVADNGQAALSLLNQTQSDLILLDLRMPVMDGWSFVRAYRSVPGRHVPIIAVSGSDVVEHSAYLAADDYLAKPFDILQLLSTVQKHLQ
jgi:CheY-like chemotaxis protein